MSELTPQDRIDLITGKKQLNKEDKHIIANDAAEHFLKLLCDEY